MRFVRIFPKITVFSRKYRKNRTEAKAEYSSITFVGADGASSYVRHHLFPKFRPNTYTAIQQSFLRDDGEPFFSCVFDGERDGFMRGVVLQERIYVSRGAFPRDEINGKGLKSLRPDFQEKFKMKLGKPENTSACEVVRPKSKKDCFTGEGNVFSYR